MKQIVTKLWISLKLLRLIAVISSSMVAILSSLLPLYLYSNISNLTITSMFLFLTGAAILFHGVLVHIFNDYADHLSGTDAKSPAILSGGSRVIQEGIFTPEFMWNVGKLLTAILLLLAIVLAFTGLSKLSLLIIVGIWAAVSYSLPPFRLSYRPFLGEWLSLFPAFLFLGIAGPWLLLDTIPVWAYQNAMVNALVCMAWVMVHHIPDQEADITATPPKRTSVVWTVQLFRKSRGVKLPAVVYLILTGAIAFWMAFTRPFAALLVGVFVLLAIGLLKWMDSGDVYEVTKVEKYLLLFAVVIGLGIGILF
jgi:1,4-dihydroxy-2-naphthoate octaprenyltransferase